MNVSFLNEIEKNYKQILPYINQTPVLHWISPEKNRLMGEHTQIYFKCELFQRTGTFKIRGALTRMFHLTNQEKKKGVVAGTGGNHGIAVAHVAKLLDIDATIVVPKTMNSLRLEKIRALNAKVVQVGTISDILKEMNEIAESEHRIVIHPFEHPKITLGTASLGFEFLKQVPDLDVIIVPVGGGGLASGLSCAAKLMNPSIQVYGVEPESANSMYLSFKEKQPVKLNKKPNTIADSLCAPGAEMYSYEMCKKYVDDVVLVSDDEIRKNMKLLFEYLKMACEPACAVSTAAMLGPLKEKCLNKKVGVILCGSNIDIKTYSSIMSVL